jgi:N-acyl-D-aspartate/D-glutamate deacylase
VEETVHHQEAAGIPLHELAKERGSTPFDVLVDVALDDALATRFRVVLENDAEDEIGELLADKRTLLGLSDAGAHASQLCDANYATHLLGHWVRDRKAISLEDAVWRLTGQIQQAFRIRERGLVREGWFADLVVLDPETVGPTPVQRVADQPGGADRLISRSTGVRHVWVNGVAVREDGEDVGGVAPGRLLRS